MPIMKFANTLSEIKDSLIEAKEMLAMAKQAAEKTNWVINQ